MKNHLQTLLIFLALCLCGLTAYQWLREARVRQDITAVTQVNYDQSLAIQNYTNTINRQDLQIAQIDKRLTEARDVIASNSMTIISLIQATNHLGMALEAYSNGVVMLQAQVKQARESIKQANETIKAAVGERDEWVKRANEAVKDRNETVKQYNDLVKQVEEMQNPKKKEK